MIIETSAFPGFLPGLILTGRRETKEAAQAK